MRVTVFRQWIAGLACLALLVVALVRTFSDVELTYEPGTWDSGPVAVQCVGLPDRLVLSSDRQYHRILEGESVLTDRANRDLTADSDGVSETRRGIDNDCLRAQDSRTLEVIWWLAGALLCAIVFAMARLRLPLPGDIGNRVGL